MNEIDKMRKSELADMEKPEIQASFIHAKKLLAKMRTMTIYDEDFRQILEELVPNIPITSIICPPFYCDHGTGIKLGEHVFVNSNCTFLDGGYITIGAHTLIGPNVQLYTATHPINANERFVNDWDERSGDLFFRTKALPIAIEDNVWIGGGTIVLPGITIGRNSVIGAGSVVTKSIPTYSVAVGNPCRVIRELPKEDL